MGSIIVSIIMILIGISGFKDRHNPAGMYFINDNATVAMKTLIAIFFMGTGMVVLLGGM